MIKIIKSKLILKIIAAVLMLAAAAACFTVNAWFVRPETANINASGTTVQAATISASLEVSSPTLLGIPGESAEVTITLINDGSDRAYAYEIKIPDDWKGAVKGNDASSGEELGTATLDAAWIWTDKPAGTVRGIMNIGEVEKEITLRIDFTGAQENYDGNVTQGDEINLDAITVTYVQATPAAIADVFGLEIDSKEVTDLMEGVN
jgi:hypothetical protein